jgi:hypothetical protein
LAANRPPIKRLRPVEVPTGLAYPRSIINLQLLPELADRIAGHYERHGIAWDADRRKSGWNDEI